jgi:hypothetical protein
VECLAHLNLGTVFRKASDKRREAEAGVGVPGELSSGAICACELPEAENEFRIVGGSGKFKMINSETMMLGKDWTYQLGRRLSLAIMDL